MRYDAGKQVKGHKIHALVEGEGLPMRVVVHSAAIRDRDGTRLVLDKIRRRFPCRLSGENCCTIVEVIFDFQYNLRPSWPDLIRPSTEASPRSEGVDGRVEHGHDEIGWVCDQFLNRLSFSGQPCFPRVELIWADGGYNARQVDAVVAKVPLLRMAIVKRSDETKGFVVLPRRWVVELTFSWVGRNQRLAKDFENLAETRATFVTIASMQLALRRLARA